MPAYDPNNIFAKILRGEIPSVKVFEDDTVLVMMDIFPQSKGHTLVIPKAASRNLLDAEPEAFAAVAAYLPRLARAVKAATRADGIRLVQFSEAPAGQKWVYKTLETNLLGDLVAAATGQSLAAYAKKKIVDPAGFAGPMFWMTDLAGANMPGSRFARSSRTYVDCGTSVDFSRKPDCMVSTMGPTTATAFPPHRDRRREFHAQGRQGI